MLIILTCLICALICVMGVMAVTRCLWACPHSIPQTNTDEVVPDECLKRKIVNFLPRRVFRPAGLTVSVTAKNDKAVAAECVICLAEFADGEEVREFPGCGHMFHVECISTWLIGSHSCSCPTCRQTLVENQCQTCKTGVSVVSQQQEDDFLP